DVEGTVCRGGSPGQAALDRPDETIGVGTEENGIRLCGGMGGMPIQLVVQRGKAQAAAPASRYGRKQAGPAHQFEGFGRQQLGLKGAAPAQYAAQVAGPFIAGARVDA